MPNTLSIGGLTRIVAILLAVNLLHGLIDAADQVTGNGASTVSVTDEATGEVPETADPGS